MILFRNIAGAEWVWLRASDEVATRAAHAAKLGKGMCA